MSFRFSRIIDPSYTAILFIVLLSAPSLAEQLVPAQTVGISAERLQRVDALSQRYVGEGRVAGMVTLVSRHGKRVQARAEGALGLDNPLPMQMDTLFRIYSMTKAVTAVAALMLYEEGRFHLDDPVEQFLPSLAGLQVEDEGGLRAATTPMTMHHLFTHMAGFSMAMGMPRIRLKLGPWIWRAVPTPQPILSACQNCRSNMTRAWAGRMGSQRMYWARWLRRSRGNAWASLWLSESLRRSE